MRKLRTAFFASALAAAGCPLMAQGAAHPNLSGVWVMDTTKTEMGPMMPTAMTYTITQDGNAFKINRNSKSSQGDVSTDLVYTLDGKPAKNSVTQMGQTVDVSSVLSWEGSSLVITSTISIQGQEVHQVEKLTADAAGKTMTSDRSIEAGGQSFATKAVFTKR
jgi:hypothetical protein